MCGELALFAPRAPSSRCDDGDSSRPCSSCSEGAPPRQPPRSRRLEEDFRLQPQILGTGSFCAVRLAVCRQTGRRAAVKSFHKPKMRAKWWQYALNEAQICMSLDHPNIVQLYQVYEERNALHLAMECLEGGELFGRLAARKRFPEYKVVEIGQQVLSAIVHMHSRGVVHCDIKLENLVYECKGSECVKLIDFGFAQRYDGKRPLSRRCGSFPYIAPEVLTGSYTEKADLWSAGVVLYMLLTGRSLYKGTEHVIRKKGEKDRDLRLPVKAAVGKPDYAPEFQSFAPGARSSIQALLSAEPRERPTAKDALAHPWLCRRWAPQGNDGALDELARSVREHAGPALEQRFESQADELLDLCLRADKSALRDQFCRVDTDGDGTLTQEELKSAFGTEYEAEANWLFEALDANGDGEVTWSEWTASARPRWNIPPLQTTTRCGERCQAVSCGAAGQFLVTWLSALFQRLALSGAHKVVV